MPKVETPKTEQTVKVDFGKVPKIDIPNVKVDSSKVIEAKVFEKDEARSPVDIAKLFSDEMLKIMSSQGTIAKPITPERTIDLTGIRANLDDIMKQMPEGSNTSDIIKVATDSIAASTQKLMSSIDQLSSALNQTTTTKTNIGTVPQMVNHNSVTINVNQKDKQEIEQIIYKVLYDQKGKQFYSNKHFVSLLNFQKLIDVFDFAEGP